MDILNWLYLRKEQLIRKTANNADTDLIAVGADVTFAKRDDKYKTYAMPIKDLSVAGDVANTGYYTLYINDTIVVDVTTQKGVIEVIGGFGSDPLPGFASAAPIVIANAEMDFSNADNVYMQVTPYYLPEPDDTFIPYVLATGFLPTGAALAIFNANPAIPGALLTFTASGGTTIVAEAGNTYTAVPTAGSAGSGATFTVTRDGAGTISTVTLVSVGSGYEVGDVLSIDGSLIGGVDGVDDLFITVDSTTPNNQFGGRFYLYYELYNF